MPSANELRQSRRDAIKIFSRIAQSLPTPERLSRDASKEVLEDFLERVTPLIDAPEEMDELKRGISLWNGPSAVLFLPESRPAGASQPAIGPRIHGADIQLTFNGDFLQGQSVSRLDTRNLFTMCLFSAAQNFLFPCFSLTCQVAQWWPAAGQLLVQSFLDWGTQIFPSRFTEKVKHTSLTIEQSTGSDTGRVHLHAQFTFERRIDRTLFVELDQLAPVCGL
eukprot:Skav212010  [mRNA]  locus=scaffold3771:16119:17002:- [translate_table: standard]